ncbi:MAG: glycosyltransferase family 2 protein [Candidatus Acidiferrum sp.]
MKETERNNAQTNALGWPRISMVTAVRNGARYIEETIHSILNQGYPNLEYFIVDGASTDGTVAVIQRHEKHLAGWMSEPDQGLYDGLNKGFARTTGEIMGWLNASDMLQTNGLFVVGSVFATLPEVEWITGRATGYNSGGMTMVVKDLQRWSRFRFLAGANKYIQQESTFWRRTLWERAGGRLDSAYRDAGDCELWVRFFRFAKLYSVNALIGGYRLHPDAITSMDGQEYDRHFDEIIEREVKSLDGAEKVRLFRSMGQFMQRVPGARGLWRRFAIGELYQRPGADLPPAIEYQNDRWGFRG